MHSYGRKIIGFNCFREKGGATCGAAPAGPRDNMNSSPTENASVVINAPHEATYSLTQVVLIGTVGKCKRLKEN